MEAWIKYSKLTSGDKVQPLEFLCCGAIVVGSQNSSRCLVSVCKFLLRGPDHVVPIMFGLAIKLPERVDSNYRGDKYSELKSSLHWQDGAR